MKLNETITLFHQLLTGTAHGVMLFLVIAGINSLNVDFIMSIFIGTVLYTLICYKDNNFLLK